MIFVVFLLALIISAMIGNVIGGGLWWLTGPLVLLGIAEICFTIRTKSLFGLITFIILQLYTLWRIPIAFFKYKPRKISDYPTDPVVIKKAAGT